MSKKPESSTAGRPKACLRAMSFPVHHQPSMALELLKSSLREIGISTIVLSPDHDAPLECVPSAPVTQEGKKSRFGEDLPPTRVAAWGLIEKGVLWHAVTRRQ